MADRDRSLPEEELPIEVELPAETSAEAGRFLDSLEDLGDRLEIQCRQMRLLADFSDRLTSGAMLGEVLNFLFEGFRPLLPYDRIGLSFLEGHPPNTAVRAAWARSDSPVLFLVEGYCAPLAGSSLETILQDRKPRVINDLEAYLRDRPQSDATARIVKEGMCSSLTCPLVAQGNPIGFLFFSSRTPGAYEGAHVALYQILAGTISLAVERGRLYGQLLEVEALKQKLRSERA
jgi:GAF domain-containing protein